VAIAEKTLGRGAGIQSAGFPVEGGPNCAGVKRQQVAPNAKRQYRTENRAVDRFAPNAQTGLIR